MMTKAVIENSVSNLGLIADVAHVLGFDRIGNGLDRAISQEIDAMIAAGEIESVADSLRLAPAAPG